jgi:hypothetical protein
MPKYKSEDGGRRTTKVRYKFDIYATKYKSDIKTPGFALTGRTYELVMIRTTT